MSPRILPPYIFLQRGGGGSCPGDVTDLVLWLSGRILASLFAAPVLIYQRHLCLDRV